MIRISKILEIWEASTKPNWWENTFLMGVNLTSTDQRRILRFRRLF